MQHDVFICHASEDKDTIVRPLAGALRDQHIDVWYDEFSLKVGDGLRRAIDQGLASSRYGVVIISPAFFAKAWTQRELSGLVAREMGEGRNVVLPIWHEVELGDVLKFSPPLADVRALRSSIGIQRLCRELLFAIRPSESPLVVARDELQRFGWETPPFSDEWWLDQVEEMESQRFGYFTRPWHFPLPDPKAFKGRGRGVNIAWTALQLDWQSVAEHRKICQTTEPQMVLAFVRENAALHEACRSNPRMLANYAPQLLIPEFSDEYGPAFDELLAKSEVEAHTRPDQRFPNATCDRHMALRHPSFGGHSAYEIADKWVDGLGGDHSAKVHKIIDYLFWLLAEDSAWMPHRVREILTAGMRDWAAWIHDIHSEKWDGGLTHAIFAGRKTPMKWSRRLRSQLVECAETTVRKLGLTGDPVQMADAFIERDFVGGYDLVYRERKRP